MRKHQMLSSSSPGIRCCEVGAPAGLHEVIIIIIMPYWYDNGCQETDRVVPAGSRTGDRSRSGRAFGVNLWLTKVALVSLDSL